MNTEQTVENEDVKVLWDFNIQVDKFIEARRPDIILVRKKNNERVIIAITVLGDIRTVGCTDNSHPNYNWSIGYNNGPPHIFPGHCWSVTLF